MKIKQDNQIAIVHLKFTEFLHFQSMSTDIYTTYAHYWVLRLFSIFNYLSTNKLRKEVLESFSRRRRIIEKLLLIVK